MSTLEFQRKGFKKVCIECRRRKKILWGGGGGGVEGRYSPINHVEVLHMENEKNV